MKSHAVLLTLIVLMVVLALPAVARERGGPDIFTGDGRIMIDDQGRVAIVIDDGGDGLADQVFVFSPEAPLTAELDRLVSDATVVYGGDTLHVTAADNSILIDLAIAGQVGVHTGDPATTLRVTQGLELIRQEITTGVPIDQYDAGQSIIGLYSDIGFGPQPAAPLTSFPDSLIDYNAAKCQAGGIGSVSCEVDCGSAPGCSVSCGAGYYACCNCGGLFQMPSCKCTQG